MESQLNPVDLLVFGPHPDDIEIGVGGTVAKHASRGDRVGLCDLTAGEMGSNGTVEERLAEAEAARAVLGAAWRVNLRWPDRSIGRDPEHERSAAALVRSARPRAVALSYWSDRHPDHVAASRVVAEAVFSAGLAGTNPIDGWWTHDVHGSSRRFTAGAAERPDDVRYTMRSAEIQLLLDVVDRAYNKRSWHGTNLRGSIRGLTAAPAAWRPGPGRHSIWELVVHAAYWKYAVCRRLTGERRGSFPLKGSNWFPRPDAPAEQAWRADVALLERMHRDLREAIALTPGGRLQAVSPGAKTSNFELIAGIAAHDLYHAGQIQLLKRLQRST